MEKNRGFSIIAAVRDSDFAIGSNGDLPWKNKNDLAYFRKVTTGNFKNTGIKNVCIMGWKTFLSMKKPLPNRVNIILTTTKSEEVKEICNKSNETTYIMNSLDKALEFCYNEMKLSDIFVIGGSMLYKESIHHVDLKQCFITVITLEGAENFIVADTFFPSNFPLNANLPSVSLTLDDYIKLDVMNPNDFLILESSTPGDSNFTRYKVYKNIKGSILASLKLYACMKIIENMEFRLTDTHKNFMDIIVNDTPIRKEILNQLSIDTQNFLETIKYLEKQII